MSDINIVLENRDDIHVAVEEKDINVEVPAGKDGRSLRPRGEWSASVAYAYLDLVSYQGSSYAATRAVPVGTLPTDTSYWMLSAEKGEPGGSVWGNITGDLSDQTDLQEALDSKADASDVEEGFADVAEALAGKANADDVYTKTETDTLLGAKADVGDSYTKTEEDTLLNAKANSADVYTKTETDTLLADKADADDVYTKTEVDDALALKANSADVYTKTATDALLLDKAPVILNSASGSIASFADGSPAPVTALSVGIDPMQDLHGYDNPWPAGGGANIWDEEYITTGFFSVDGTWTVGSALSSKNPISVQPNTTYYLVNGSNTSIYVTYWTEAVPSGVSDTTHFISRSSDLKNSTFTTPANCNAIHFNAGSAYGTAYKNDISINYPSTVTTYQPYANICPISGHASAVVTRTGKNLFDPNEVELGKSYNGTANAKRCVLYKKFPTGTYTASLTNYQNFTEIVFGSAVAQYDRTNTQAQNIVILSRNSYTFIIDAQRPYFYFFAINTNDVTLADIQAINVQLERSSTASAYEAPNIQTVTIDLDGTRYGGTLDVLTGEMTVTKVFETFDGSSDETISKSTVSGMGIFVVGLQNNMPYPDSHYIPPIISNIAKTVVQAGSWSQYDFFAITTTVSQSGKVNILGKNIVDTLTPTEFRAWLSSTPLQVCYELATPITVQLSPSQMQTLLGQNNLLADTGDVAVEYRADTKLYIDGKFSQLQALILEN